MNVCALVLQYPGICAALTGEVVPGLPALALHQVNMECTEGSPFFVRIPFGGFPMEQY